MIVFACASCGKKYRAKPAFAGRRMTCKHCRQGIVIPRPETTERWREADNSGTRLETHDRGIAWWGSGALESEPNLAFRFLSPKVAEQALLEVPCIHLASDTEKLICTELYTFGVFGEVYTVGANGERVYDRWMAVLAGKTLDLDTWSKAKSAFEYLGGIEVNTIEPDVRTGTPEARGQDDDGVVFMGEERREIRDGVFGTYRKYSASGLEAARRFALANPVQEQFVYLEIRTPEGGVGRDKNGMYTF